MRTVEPHRWASIASNMNMVSLLAPALGPILAGYITNILGWRWLFFIKLPLSVACFCLTALWLKKETTIPMGRFDWLGFIFSAISLSTFFIALSKIGENRLGGPTASTFLLISLLCLIAFILTELKVEHPMIPLSIFRFRLFSIGNLIQSAANILFLGSTFVTSLYLQEALHYDMITTGWVLAAITPGMIAAMPFVSRYYNRLGPLPFIIPGLLLMSAAMFALILITPTTSPWLVAGIISCLGAGSAMVQTPNVMAIFCELPSELKGIGSSVYALGKQLSASIGVAASTMILALTMSWFHIPQLAKATPAATLGLFTYVFVFLGIIPLLALPLCFLMDNKRALALIKKQPHLESETELEGAKATNA